MEQTATIPTKKNFSLTKVKLLPNGGLEAEYQITEVVGDEPSISDCKTVCTRDVHPDLKQLFAELRAIVAQTFGFFGFLPLLDGAGNGLKEKGAEFAQAMADKIDVRGVSWSGAGDKAGVVLSSVYEVFNGLKTAINTPRIKLGQESFGFEEDLEDLTEQIKDEVYAFLYEGKQAQLSLFGDNAETSGEPGDDLPGM